MEYLVSASKMRSCDRFVIDRYGVPSLVLMERAALGCVELLYEKGFDLTRVLVAAGSGNNGGDGMAMARLLHLRGVTVSVWFVGDQQHLTKEAALQKKICENYGINFVRKLEDGEYTTIVDAIFGSGLSREVTGTYKEAIETINRLQARVLAVDIPSGIRSDDGSVAQSAVRSDVTGALAFRKIGHLLYPGAKYAGEVVLLDIGITKEVFSAMGDGEGGLPAVRCLEREDFNLLSKRQADSNKGTFGKACLVAGSRDMAGAAYLSGKAAYLTGTGLVQVISDECNRNILQTLLPEALFGTKTPHCEEQILKAVSWADALGIGPGLSTGQAAEECLRTVLQCAEIPLVLDADALNILAEHPEWLDTPRKMPVIVTPHMGEMARLTRCTIKELREKRLELSTAFARDRRVILILKDARTLITDGERIILNETGNDGMATGGAGDVLTGIVTGLLAQGMEPFMAAAFGVYLHGLSGDEARKRKGARGMLSTDLLDVLPFVLKEGQISDERY